MTYHILILPDGRREFRPGPVLAAPLPPRAVLIDARPVRQDERRADA